jgi:hypothetical protein
MRRGIIFPQKMHQQERAEPEHQEEIAMALWRRFATEEQIAAIKAACDTDIFAILELATFEQRLQEEAYGRCDTCNDILAWNGVCYRCLGTSPPKTSERSE